MVRARPGPKGGEPMSDSTVAPPAGATESAKLHRRALGVPDLVFFIVAASAPLTAVAGGQAATYLVTGNRAVAFMFIPLGIVLSLFTVGYAAMSRYIENAGAFYAYVSKGLGRVSGIGAAFVALIAYNSMQIGIYGLFGVAMGGFMSGYLGIDLPWWLWCVVAGVVIALLGVLQIDLNARVLAVMLGLEVLIVALFDIAILGDPGPQGLTMIGFSPTIAFSAAVGATLTFCVASFVGFESAAIYSEECRDPRRTVARATYLAVGLIAVFYAISSWLLGVAARPNNIVDPNALVKAGFATDGAPDPTTVLFITGAERLGQIWGTAAALLFATSLFAVLVFAIAAANPVLTLFTWLTNLGALGVLLLMAATSFAVVGYFRRRPQDAVGSWASTWAPGIAGVLLLVLLVLGVANFNVLITGLTDAPIDTMTVVLPVILFGGGIGGLIVGAFLKRSRPDVYERIGGGAGAEE